MPELFLKYSLPSGLTVPQATQKFAGEPHLLVLDSARGRRHFDARYSYLTASPVETCRIDRVAYGDDPFAMIRAMQRRLPKVTAEAPPFCGGVAGLFGYEIGQAFERLPRPAQDPIQTPPVLAGLYDWAIVWDHHMQSVDAWVLDVDHSNVSLNERLEWLLQRLHTDDSGLSTSNPQPSIMQTFEEVRTTDVVLPGSVAVQSVFDEPGYLSAVRRVIDYIREGDIFQANLSQQLTGAWTGSAIELMEKVQTLNPAPFCGLLVAPDFAVVSASPERFLKVDSAGRVETRPIKGTRRRQRSPVADLLIGEELKASVKDRAENVMIVDLLRNDISRVCEVGSVRVTGVCELEVFETVQHLVSTVVGQLRSDCDVWDLCAATLPGGSITGAPKIRAMEIIAELEPVVRGAYCGNLFYCGPQGDFDSSILIRTFTLKNGRVQFPVGGGIVADSDPMNEYEETLHKASGMLSVLNEQQHSS